MKRSILVCDDEEGIRESLKLILEKEYLLSFAKNGYEAIEKLKNEIIDLVLLDIKMPKISGFDTIKELRKINPEIKIIMVSGYKSIEIIQEIAKIGATEYITKPFDSKDVLTKVKKILK